MADKLVKIELTAVEVHKCLNAFETHKATLVRAANSARDDAELYDLRQRRIAEYDALAAKFGALKLDV